MDSDDEAEEKAKKVLRGVTSNIENAAQDVAMTTASDHPVLVGSEVQEKEKEKEKVD